MNWVARASALARRRLVPWEAKRADFWDWADRAARPTGRFRDFDGLEASLLWWSSGFVELAVSGDFWGVAVRRGVLVVGERIGREGGEFGLGWERVELGLAWRMGSGVCC